MTEEVISFTPTWQVITFKSLAHAKTILLSKYHHHIISDSADLARKKTMEDLHNIINYTLQLKNDNNTLRHLRNITDKKTLAQELWPMLVILGRRTTNLVFNKNVKKSVLPTHTMYYCDYVPGTDTQLDINYIKLPPQARALVDMFVEKIQPAGKQGVPEYIFVKYVNELKENGTLKTKQNPINVFYFYKQVLIAKGFIDIIIPRG